MVVGKQPSSGLRQVGRSPIGLFAALRGYPNRLRNRTCVKPCLDCLRHGQGLNQAAANRFLGSIPSSDSLATPKNPTNLVNVVVFAGHPKNRNGRNSPCRPMSRKRHRLGNFRMHIKRPHGRNKLLARHHRDGIRASQSLQMLLLYRAAIRTTLVLKYPHEQGPPVFWECRSPSAHGLRIHGFLSKPIFNHSQTKGLKGGADAAFQERRNPLARHFRA